MGDREKIVKRIQKLLALSKSDNENEAKLAASFASELMERHQLSMSEVDLEEMRRSEVIYEKVEIVRVLINNDALWVTFLAKAAAKLFDADIVVSTGKSFSVLFVGFPEDVEMSKEMFSYLFNTWISMCKNDLNQEMGMGLVGDLMKMITGVSIDLSDSYVAGHGQGFSDMINLRVDALVKERKERVGKTTIGKELVVMKRDEVENKLNELTSDEISLPRKVRGVAYATGANRGTGVDLKRSRVKEIS